MKKNNLTLKETFKLAVEYYNNKNYLVAENLCTKILSIDPDHFESMVLQSNMFAIKGNYKKAKELLIRANETQPDNLSVLNNLGTACKELRDTKEAITYYEKVLQLNPKHTNAQFNLGVAFYQLRDLKKAKDFFTKTTQIQPNYALAFINLANVCVELKEYENAVSNYQKSIEVNPKIVSAHNNLGLVFRTLNDYDNAISCYKKALELNPKHGGAHHNLALALKELGNFKEAIKSHEAAIECEPDNLINYFYLNDLKKEILNSNLKNKIIKIIKKKNQPKNNIAYGNYLLSKYERKDNNYKKELNYLIEGHKYFFNSKKEKFELAVKYCFQDLIQISQGVKVDKLNNKKEKKIKPIFIIGVPRCGSTLVEKIIGSGKNFIPMGEETAVLENYINFKILEKQSLNLGDVNDEISNIYKNKGLILEKFQNRFTDKSLNNFFYLELIHDIYPNAKIINCQRDVLSSIMSIFQNNITELAWTHDLSNIFKYFNNYFEIIRNYKKVNDNSFYDLKFEDLVNNPEIETKKLMEFCDLPWDKKCLEFYKRKDLISKTASNVQVRQAIYKHTLEKYIPYKKLLDEYGKQYSWFK